MAAVVYLIADLLLLIPAFFLAIGVQAIGRSAGWWLGDSNSNDGEEFLGTSIGVLAMLIVLPAAGVVARQVLRRSDRGALVPIAVGTGLTIAGVVGLCVWVVLAG